MPSSQNRSLATRRTNWGLIFNGRQRLMAEMPQLEEDIDELESVNKDIAELASKQRYYMGKAREATGKLRLLSKHGDRLRARIGASLRGKYGYGSQKLVEFGFTPRRSTPLEKPTNQSDPRDDFPGEPPAE